MRAVSGTRVPVAKINISSGCPAKVSIFYPTFGYFQDVSPVNVLTRAISMICNVVSETRIDPIGSIRLIGFLIRNLLTVEMPVMIPNESVIFE